jgi:metal-sulfur cluster biosynthetic enzyme|uniref:Metal-sulfur cluster assembly factor n=1 Tax=Ignisphaera aggregans TaxID=334771 RepID=A0A7J2U2U0_9CREN
MTGDAAEKEEFRQRIVNVLKSVYDPEIPINIYDLGLVYSISINNSDLEVTLGLTTPFCPIAYLVVQQAENALKQAFPDKNIKVKLDLERQWSPSMMTDEGKKLFKLLYGYDPSEFEQR